MCMTVPALNIKYFDCILLKLHTYEFWFGMSDNLFRSTGDFPNCRRLKHITVKHIRFNDLNELLGTLKAL